MSVCFFVPGNVASDTVSEDGAAGSTAGDGVPEGEEAGAGEGGSAALHSFWLNVMDDVRKVTAEDFKSQVLPLARIKKIMKLDDDVKMISAEAPMLFAKAAEIFIHELTLRAWVHTEDNKRRTLQRNDIAMAISKSDQFDFLIDIVPRHEVKMHKPRDDLPKPNTSTDQVGYYLQLAQQHQQALQAGTAAPACTSAAPQQAATAPSQPHILLHQPHAQIHHIQASGGGGGGSGGGAGGGSGAGAGAAAAQPVALIQNVVTPAGDVLPIQLSQAQMNLIRLQMQNNSSQPIVLQAQTQQQPQIIQVSSQGQTASPGVFLQTINHQSAPHHHDAE